MQNDFNLNTISAQKAQNEQSKLANLPIMLFASVMEVGGLALVFKKASTAFAANASAINSHNFLSLSEIFECASFVFGFLSMGIFVLLFAFYVAKIFMYFDKFKAEITHQVKINFLSALPIGVLIIITFLGAFNDSKSVLFALQIAFYASAFLQLILSIYVINFWFGNAMKLHLLSPLLFSKNQFFCKNFRFQLVCKEIY